MRTLQIGMFGLGVVGSAVVAILQNNRDLIRARLGAELRVAKAVVGDPNKSRPVDLTGIEVSTDPATILNDPEIDLVVELIGGTTTARDVVLKALEAGKPVVTANKALLAECAEEVFGKVYETDLPLGMEAAVAGGVPVLRSLKEGLSGEHILEISGIVNGTCNYILTRMTEEGAAFDEVLADAQRLGYAEAEPSFDVDGIDAAHKLAVLVNIAYGTTVDYDAIHVEGIRKITPLDIDYARTLGYAVKLLAIGKLSNGAVEARVHPTLIAHEHLLASVNGVFNAVFLTGDNVDASLSYGRGAGGAPTGGAVVSDLMDIARNLLAGIRNRVPALSVIRSELMVLPVMPMEQLESEYYLRFQVLDRVGVLAHLTRVMGENNISIQSAIQPSQGEHPDDPVQVIFITHRAREADIQASLAAIAPMEFIAGETQLIRIERLVG